MAKGNLVLTFVNPPHADWCLTNVVGWISMQSHYKVHGKFNDKVVWQRPPIRYNNYCEIDEIVSEIINCDVVLFSSYIWNFEICDAVAERIKSLRPEVITIVGGPHIGANEPEFLNKRKKYYDFFCRPTKPGEIFIESWLNEYFQNDGNVSAEIVDWEMNSLLGRNLPFGDRSIYVEHFEFLRELNQYSRDNNLEPFIVIETTRGCPYHCSYCEWGGGTNTKIIQKPLEIVKQDILALKKAGFDLAYLTDANFGVFEERDIEIFRFAFENQFALSDISTVKSKILERRKRIVDAWFEIVGKGKEERFQEATTSGKALTGLETRFISSLPTVSIQSISDTAMAVAGRVDLSFADKIKLSEHIRIRCEDEGYPVPALELILGMPGSTLNDFYNEMEIIWNFKAWNSFRHDYMFLPDTEISTPEYLKKYQIELVEVYTDLVDEEGRDHEKNLYTTKRNHFKTIRKCFSFSEEQLKEMFFMNLAGNYLLENIYPGFLNIFTPAQFGKHCFEIIKTLDGFEDIKLEIDQLYDPNQQPKSIKKLCGQYRLDTIKSFLKDNHKIIINELFLILVSHDSKEVALEI